MANQNWWQTSNIGPGSNYGYGGTGAISSFRDNLDSARSKGPNSADYPDGYLGTIVDRRQDKLLGAVQKRLNDRAYQRGVHVGSQVDSSEYFWPDAGEVRPTAGIEAQARGRRVGNVIDTPRWTPRGNVTEKLAHMGKSAIKDPAEADELYQRYGVDGDMSDIVIDPVRAEKLKEMLPPWSR